MPGPTSYWRINREEVSLPYASNYAIAKMFMGEPDEASAMFERIVATRNDQLLN